MTENIDAHNAELIEANQRLRSGYADAAAGLEYVRVHHGKLCGVGFDRVADHFFQWVTMPEREGLLAGSHKLPSARITGDKGRENPAEGAPYGEGLIGRIDTLEVKNAELRRALAYAQGEQLRLMQERHELERQLKVAREALGATEGAIAEYYRYWTGGEMRGSYDGKPERNGLWQALHKARQSLAGAKP